jgi:phosphoglycolate phosphatase-like HAD superfamily hydrolase
MNGNSKSSAGPLPSWRETETKSRILAQVAAITSSSSPDFVPAAQRVAVFDGDGTLWAEKPYYFELFFAVHLAQLLSKKNKNFASTPLLEAAAKGDIQTVFQTKQGMDDLINAVKTGHTIAEFEKYVRDWKNTAKHPDTGKLFSQMFYQPMAELINYLTELQFRVHIVSGSGQDFLRGFASDALNLPLSQVIGSSSEYKYVIEGDVREILIQEGYFFFDNKEFKAIAVARTVGTKPQLAGGNSDGDIEMLSWTSGNDRSHLEMLVHHTDASREYAYDRESKEGRLDEGISVAQENNWLLIDMANDWETIWLE